jgi:hypothetical protein
MATTVVVGVLLCGCSASVGLGTSGAASKARTSAAVGHAMREGEWVARGLVLSARGPEGIPRGAVLLRQWFFSRKCAANGHCAIYWTRPIPGEGADTAKIVAHGVPTTFTASFRNESAPCFTPSGVVVGVALIESDFTAHVGPGPDHMSAMEHTHTTTPTSPCPALDRTIRWTAIRVSKPSPTQPSS